MSIFNLISPSELYASYTGLLKINTRKWYYLSFESSLKVICSWILYIMGDATVFFTGVHSFLSLFLILVEFLLRVCLWNVPELRWDRRSGYTQKSESISSGKLKGVEMCDNSNTRVQKFRWMLLISLSRETSLFLSSAYFNVGFDALEFRQHLKVSQ